MGNANVSGFYFDDDWLRSGQGWDRGPAALPHRTAEDVNISDCATGPSELESHCLLDTGLSAADVLELMEGWRTTTAAAMRAVHEAGGWVWQMFSHNNATARNGTEWGSAGKGVKGVSDLLVGLARPPWGTTIQFF
jgi:hypothetical protein